MESFIKYTGKDTYFRNIFIFIKYIKNIEYLNSKVKENL